MKKGEKKFGFINVEYRTFRDGFKIWICNSPTVYQCKNINMCTV